MTNLPSPKTRVIGISNELSDVWANREMVTRVLNQY